LKKWERWSAAIGAALLAFVAGGAFVAVDFRDLLSFSFPPPLTPAQIAQASDARLRLERLENEWHACATTWSPLERRVYDGLSYEHEAAIGSWSHQNGGCAIGQRLLRSLAAYPSDRRDDVFDLMTNG
jgi:hypothetical protein